MNGVVIIDEIEQHLHPKWQSNILPSLEKNFPQVQFIVATHSSLAERYTDRKTATIEVLRKQFLEEDVPFHCKSRTAYEYCPSMEVLIKPRIGAGEVTEIRRSDIAELHHGMRKIPPYQANRTLGVLSKKFNLAEMWGLRSDSLNPITHGNPERYR